MFLAILLLWFIFFCLIFTPDDPDVYETEISFHDGSVLAKYKWTSNEEGGNDVLTLTFFSRGLFTVRLENADDAEDLDLIPEPLCTAVIEAPQTRVISRYELPKNLKVIIFKDGTREEHDL